MSYVLFIDDLRNPIDVGVASNTYEIVVARNSLDAINIVKQRGCPLGIHFDHDLGGDDTAMRFLDWFINHDMANDIIHPPFFYKVHSQNPVGRDNIIGKLDGYLNWKKRVTS